MPTALSCTVVVVGVDDVVLLVADVVAVSVGVVDVAGDDVIEHVGGGASTVVVAVRVVLERSNDGAGAGESRPTGAAEQAPSVRTAAAVATRGVIFMRRTTGRETTGGGTGRRARALRRMRLGGTSHFVNGEGRSSYRIGNRCTPRLTSAQEGATLGNLSPAAYLMSDTLGRRIFLAHLDLSYRLGRKVTLAEFGQMIAKQMGRDAPFTAAAVSRWESGTQNPTPTIVEAIAAITHTDPGWISHGRKSAAPRPVRHEQPPPLLARSGQHAPRAPSATPSSTPRRKTPVPRRKA